ncbi:xanthine dehydrogenase small subunit [Aquicoccus sp. SCR17]|nr:xanthine dehydrogenase small subunit [Carideicomes alvinocaridis]
MATRNEVRFILNGEDQAIRDVGASDTLLDFLRIDRRLTGTKEGCAEGDCGACTVLVGRLTPQGLRYDTVNACIRFLASVDGCHVVTIEHLRGPEGGLHPVQEAMVALHGSQCGFCTPGIVMSLYALWMATATPSVTEIERALQGNLCRCTGYEPIVKAAQAASAGKGQSQDPLNLERNTITKRLSDLRDGARVEVAKGEDRAILPADTADLAKVLEENPEGTIVAGATDVGLWVTKFLRPISPAIHIGHLEELHEIAEDDAAITLGAGVTYSEAALTLIMTWPHLLEYWDRIAGWQVRNMGTIGGNIANGSPIGDTPPALIALDATITLRKGGETRELPLERFFIDYGKQDRAEGEFVERIRIPKPAAGQLHAAYKISKRRDEDISSVAAAFRLTVEDGTITEARIAFGGMAATPKRAAKAEAALTGQSFDEATMMKAAATLPEDFAPLSDWRASAEYRMRAAQNLFRRFWYEKGTDEAVRLETA